MIAAVFLPADPEGTVFDAVESVDRAVRDGCRLYINRASGRMAFLAKPVAGWDLFGLHRKPAPRDAA